MPDMWMDVDVTLTEVPVNIMPLIDDGDFKARETGVVYNQAGMDLVWNLVTADGSFSQTAVTPTTGGGDHDWSHQGDGMYSIKIPATGGADISNDTEGFAWFTGYCTGVLPWRGPVIGFRAASHNNYFIEGTLADLANLIADHTIRRTFQNACDSSNGDTKTLRSLLGAIAKLVNKVAAAGATLTIYEDDDTTALGTQAITTNAAADPITALDTN